MSHIMKAVILTKVRIQRWPVLETSYHHDFGGRRETVMDSRLLGNDTAGEHFF